MADVHGRMPGIGKERNKQVRKRVGWHGLEEVKENEGDWRNRLGKFR